MCRAWCSLWRPCSFVLWPSVVGPFCYGLFSYPKCPSFLLYLRAAKVISSFHCGFIYCLLNWPDPINFEFVFKFQWLCYDSMNKRESQQRGVSIFEQFITTFDFSSLTLPFNTLLSFALLNIQFNLRFWRNVLPVRYCYYTVWWSLRTSDLRPSDIGWEYTIRLRSLSDGLTPRSTTRTIRAHCKKKNSG